MYMGLKMTVQNKIEFISSEIRENRIEHARLKKELNKLLQEFDEEQNDTL